MGKAKDKRGKKKKDDKRKKQKKAAAKLARAAANANTSVANEATSGDAANDSAEASGDAANDSAPDDSAASSANVATTTNGNDDTQVTVDTASHHKTATVSEEKVAASKAVIEEWARRVEAEYRSAAITQHLTLWLIQMGVSPDLIHDGLRIVTDELAHAQLSHETFVAAGGTQVNPIARESLALRLPVGEPLEKVVTRHGVEVFCLGETVAVPLFKVLREDCTVPTARRALDRILKDEVRHRDFGWTLLEYLVSTPAETLTRAVVEEELPHMFARIRRSYAPVGGEKRVTISKADRSWGLMPIATYGEILERTLERDYRPRFKALGFDIDDAWKRACELHPSVG